MNQKTLLIVAMFALITTVAFGTTNAFAQQTPSNGGVAEDDENSNTSNTATKVKDTANCNISGFSNNCDQDTESELDASEDPHNRPM